MADFRDELTFHKPLTAAAASGNRIPKFIEAPFIVADLVAGTLVYDDLPANVLVLGVHIVITTALTFSNGSTTGVSAKIGNADDDGPIRWNPRRRRFVLTPAEIVSFETSVGVDQNLFYSSPASFTTTLVPSVSAGGIGPTDPDGPAEFETEVTAAQQFVAGQPTLVNFNTSVGVGQTVQGGAPVEFETTVGVKQSIRTIANGDRRRLSDRRYRR